VDTQNSQKRSPRSSAKSERNRPGMAQQEQTHHRPVADFDHEEYMDRSIDHVARVRAAKDAAQREMESFGDVSEYDITILQGQLKEDPGDAPLQSSLDFQSDAPNEPPEAD
jgi:hypothetical protein